MANDAAVTVLAGCIATCFVAIIVTVIVVLASIKAPTADQQLVIEYLDGKAVVNGPTTKVVNPFRDMTRRNIVKLSTNQYAKIANTLTGEKRVIEGSKKEFMTAYEELEGKYNKYVIKAEEYVRFTDVVTGVERVVQGAATVTPGPWEEALDGIESATYITVEAGALVRNKATGYYRLVTSTGMFVPEPYEEVIEIRSIIRVLSTEAMVVRTATGGYQVYNGNGTGTSFFLQPYQAVVDFQWSTFSEPSDGSAQVISSETVTRIDLRSRKVFYQYEVRTVDNVALRIEGTVYWKVSDPEALIAKTADPSGDVWYRARNILMSTVSKVELQTLLASFNTIIQTAFLARASDSFWSSRGIQVESMEVTGYECVDEETEDILQAIIEETTNRINRLQVQESENDVAVAKLTADIVLEQENEVLVRTQKKNKILTAEREGEAEGVQLSKAAATFIDGLNTSIPDLDTRKGLFKLQKALENQNVRTAYLGSGQATLFITPEELQLTLNIDDLMAR
mmetsp:Transcript_65758/g.142710  ORF Transcript_65758/g.142710 Transcript_65758/m.142710 type:complete len:510 (+) Transcript_65758:46-1575(+)|eukprot:CAMPEP_0206553086 /NCGR_PEP_ID=MMETSP0325_2-20121206/16441_1 /ASSEMBLY_ACC=CAM_ASM_000347 /TAXON_ID=2866 /ORGANISM="Crypthecodinium cohnii, Strain Seligo" /LENGTH=509 /DNA_ID=CAMNT_0054053033 /DNA_START=13 /DNA_END=1542 /DNA_ORIENTATION=-